MARGGRRAGAGRPAGVRNGEGRRRDWWPEEIEGEEPEGGPVTEEIPAGPWSRGSADGTNDRRAGQMVPVVPQQDNPGEDRSGVAYRPRRPAGSRPRGALPKMELEKRRRKVLQLSIQGYSMRQIAAYLDCAKATVQNDLDRMLEKSQVRDEEGLNRFRDMEMARLDRVLVALFPWALGQAEGQGGKPDYRAVEYLLRIHERRSRMVGAEMAVAGGLPALSGPGADQAVERLTPTDRVQIVMGFFQDVLSGRKRPEDVPDEARTIDVTPSGGDRDGEAPE